MFFWTTLVDPLSEQCYNQWPPRGPRNPDKKNPFRVWEGGIIVYTVALKIFMSIFLSYGKRDSKLTINVAKWTEQWVGIKILNDKI